MIGKEEKPGPLITEQRYFESKVVYMLLMCNSKVVGQHFYDKKALSMPESANEIKLLQYGNHLVVIIVCVTQGCFQLPIISAIVFSYSCMTTLRKRIKTNFHGEFFFSTSQAKRQQRFMFSAHYMPLLNGVSRLRKNWER